MPNEENLLKLYNALGDEYDLGSYDDFKVKMQDSNNRSKLWSAANADYDLGDFNAFEQRIGYTGGLGKPTPGSEAGPSGGRRLPSKLNVQQVKTYLGKYGASLTDDQYRQIAEQAAGKSLEEAMNIARNIVTPQPKVQFAPMAPVAQPEELAAPAQPEFNLGTFVTEEVQRPKTQAELNALRDSQFKTQRDVLAGAFDTSTDVTKDLYKERIGKNLLGIQNLADEVTSGRVKEINLGPLGTFDLEELEKETGIFSNLKNNPDKLYQAIVSHVTSNNAASKRISEKDVLPVIDNYTEINSIRKQSDENIQRINSELEFLSQFPNTDQTVVADLQSQLKKEQAIQTMVAPTVNALYDELSYAEKAPHVAKSFAIPFVNIYSSVLSSVGEELSLINKTMPGIVSAPQLANAMMFNVEAEKAKSKALKMKEDLQYKELSDQNILDGLNLMNASRALGSGISSMGAVAIGGIAGGGAGAAMVGFNLAFGDAVKEGRKSGLSETESAIYGAIQGTVQGVLDAMGFKGVAGAVMNAATRKSIMATIRSMAAEGATKDKIIKTLADKAVRTGISFFQGAAPEALTEMAQTGAEFGVKAAFNELAIDQESGEKGFELPTLEEGFKQIGEAGIIGAVMGGFVPSVKALSLSKSNEYKDLASKVVRGDVTQESLQENVKLLINTGQITQEQAQDLSQNIDIAVAAKNSLPKYIKDKAAKERGVALIMERNKIKEEMATADPDLQGGYKTRLSQIQSELQTISDNKWKMPVDPVITSTIAGFETANTSLASHPDPDIAARVFTETMNADRGMLAIISNAMNSGRQIAMAVLERGAASLNELADSFENAPSQTDAIKEAAKSAREMANRMSTYSAKAESVTNGTIPALNMPQVIGRIAAGADPSDMGFMEDTPDDIMTSVSNTFSDIMDGKDVSERDAVKLADFLYAKYKQLTDLRTKLKAKAESETNPTKKERLTKAIASVNEVMAQMNSDIDVAVKYQQEKALRDEQMSTRTQPAVSPETASEQAQEYDPANEQEVVDDFNSKNEDQLLPGVVRAINSVAKLLAKIAPEVKFYVHTTTQDFVSALEADGVGKTDAKNSSGNTGQYISLNGKAMSVHINLEAVNREAIEMGAASRAIYHEAAHVILNKYFGSSPEVIKGMLDAVTKVIPKGISKQLDEFVANYDRNINEERIVELVEILAATEQQLDDTTISKIIKAINDFIERAANALGVQNVDRFLISDSRADFVGFVNSMARSTASGIQEISPETTKRIQKRYAVQEQAAGQVPVQPGARGGETMAEGEPEAGSEVATKASKAKAQEKKNYISGSELFKINAAPYYRTKVNKFSEALSLHKSRAYIRFKEDFSKIAEDLNLEIVSAIDSIGGWAGTSEVSTVFFVKGTWDDAVTAAALMGITAPEVQDSTIAAQIVEDGSDLHNVDRFEIKVNNPELAFKAIREVSFEQDGYTIVDDTIWLLDFSKGSDPEFFAKFDQLEKTIESYGAEIISTDRKPVRSELIDDKGEYGPKREEVISEFERSSVQQGRKRGYISDNLEAIKERLNAFKRWRGIEYTPEKARLEELRRKELELASQFKSLSKKESEELSRLTAKLADVYASVIASDKARYEEAKSEIEQIAEEVRVLVNKSAVSEFPVKRAQRGGEKVARWYFGDVTALGDGARTNIIVHTESDAEFLYEAILKTYPDDSVRSEKESTVLGYPKRLVEIRTSNGKRAEIQVMTPEGYLAKDGLKYFREDLKADAKRYLDNVRKNLGWNIPDGIGHYFYEIHRDPNVPSKIRKMAEPLSTAYYNAMLNSDTSTLTDQEFRDSVAEFKNLVDNADKSRWDKSNSGKSPAELDQYLGEQGAEAGKPGIETKASKSRVSTSYQQVAETSKYSPIKSLADTLNKLAINPKDKPVQVKASQNEGGKVRTLAMLFKDMAGSKEINFREFFNQRGNVIKGQEAALAKAVATVSDRVVEMLSLASVTYPNFQSWYKERIDMAMDIFREIDPDLKKPEDSFMFKLILAITSNGNEVKAQTDDTFKIYQNWKANKEIDYSLVRGSRAKDIKKSLKTMSNLIDIHGWKKIEDFLSRKGTVEELKAALQKEFKIDKNAIDKMVKGELATENVPFSLIIGPKLGSFWNNLNGDFNTVTMDRWFMRTFGRLTNTQIVKVTKENIKNREIRLLDAVSAFRSTAEGKKFINETGIRPLLSKPKELSISLAKYFADAENRQDIIEDSPLDELRKAANNLYKVSDGFELIEAPENGSHRRFIRQAMMSAIDRFNSQSDRKTNPAETQAILWYLEKKIHEEYGSIQKESDPDYASAAEAIAIRELGKGSVSFRPSELIGGRAGLGEGQRQLSGATGTAAEAEAQGKPGIETKASKARAKAEPKYDPDNINQGKPQLDLQTRIYDAAAKAWEVAKTKAKYEQGPMISSAVLDETGLDLGDIELATLIKDLILGKRPEYKRSDTGKYERVGTRKDRSAVLTRVIAALEQMMTDRRVNKSIMSSLLKAVKGDTTYTVENQTEVEMIVDAIFNSVNGIADVETGNALLALAMNAKGGIRAFMFGRIANEAWDKARETKDLELRQAYRDIGNAALNTLSTEATDAGRFNSIIYRLQKTHPEFIVEFEANKIRNQTEQGISDANKKKDKVNEMAKDLNNAQTQAAQQAAQSPSVQAAVNAATGGPSTQPQTPPAQKSKSQQQAQQQTSTSSPKPSAQVDNRIKELKNLLKNKFGGIQTKAARTAPAGLDPDILDIITELAENYIKKGITDPTALIAKVNADVVAAGGSLSSAYYNQMWSNVSTAATAMQNDMNASSLAGRIVGRVKQRVRPTPKSFDPIAELIDELLNKATEDLAPLPKKTPESRLDKLTRLISQYYDAKDMWEASKAKVEQRIDDLDPMKFSAADKQAMKDMLDKFFANDLSYFEIKKTPTAGAAATVDKMIREQMKQKKLEIEKILLEANTKQAQTKDEFIDQIVADIVAATGITSSRATAIARSFAEQYDKIVTKKQEEVLKRRLPLSKTFEKFKRKSNAQRAFEAIKYGMIDPSIQIYDKAGNIIETTKLFCEMFNIPYLDNETRDALTMFAEAIAETPPGILRQQVLNDMAMFMKMHQYKTQGSIGDRFLAQTYANLLTSTDTMVKAFNSNIIMYNFEFATQAVRSAAKGDFRMIPLLTRAYYGKKGVGKIWTETATKEMTDPDGFKINPGEDYYKLKDGSFISLANPKVAALSGHYEGLLRYSMGINQARAVLNNIVMAENFTNNVTGEVYRKYAKTKVGRTWGEYVTLAQRGLGALDALTTAAATNARFGDLLFDAIKFYAKKEGQKVSGREISDIVNNIQGTKPLIQLDALNTAILEMEQKFGAPVNLKDKAKKALLLSRAEEIVKDKMKDRIQQAVTTYPWLSELDQGQIADMMDMSYEVATKIGMMGTPPGTGGVLSSMLGFMGRYVRFSNIQYGTFTNAPVNAAMFILQGNTPIGALITGVRLIKSRRGFELGGEMTERLYKQSGIRTKMYGKSVIDQPIFGQYFSFTWNLEKQDMLTRFALIQGPVIAATYMAGNAVIAALASTFGDDDEEKERLINDGVKAIGKIDQKDRLLRFFGDKLSSDPKKREGVWKSIPVYVTGAMYGYDGSGYGKMQSMKAMYGIEPYTVYAYGKRVLSYRDNPVLGAMFMQMAATTDAMLFTEKSELSKTQHGLILASTYAQLNLIRDQANLRSISEIFEAFAGQRAYEGLDDGWERANKYFSKTAGNIVNNAVMPAELKNLNQDVNAVLGNYMDDPKDFWDFMVYRWPIISSAVIEGDKTGPFGYPLKTQPKRVFPIGLEQFKMPLMLNGSLNIPTVDELLSTEDATYTNLFIRNDNDTFLNPKISGYYKVDDYGDYVRESFTLEQRKQIREEYKILMRQFAEQNIDVNTPFDFKINLSMFLSFYEDVGYQRYIVNKVLGPDAKSIVIDGGDALINMGVDEMLFQKIESGMKQFEPRE